MKPDFADIKDWRIGEKGIGNIEGVPYRYEAIENEPRPSHKIYRVECYVAYVPPTKMKLEVHYVPGRQLEEFFSSWGEHGAILIDIEPITREKALAELLAFRRRATEGEKHL